MRSRRTRLSEESVSAILNQLAGGATLPIVAAAHGLGLEQLSAALIMELGYNGYEAALKRARRARRSPWASQIEDMAAAFRAGLTLKEVGHGFGVPAATVRSRLLSSLGPHCYAASVAASVAARRKGSYRRCAFSSFGSGEIRR